MFAFVLLPILFVVVVIVHSHAFLLFSDASHLRRDRQTDWLYGFVTSHPDTFGDVNQPKASPPLAKSPVVTFVSAWPFDGLQRLFDRYSRTGGEGGCSLVAARLPSLFCEDRLFLSVESFIAMEVYFSTLLRALQRDRQRQLSPE